MTELPPAHRCSPAVLTGWRLPGIWGRSVSGWGTEVEDTERERTSYSQASPPESLWSPEGETKMLQGSGDFLWHPCAYDIISNIKFELVGNDLMLTQFAWFAHHLNVCWPIREEEVAYLKNYINSEEICYIYWQKLCNPMYCFMFSGVSTGTNLSVTQSRGGWPVCV